MRPAESPGGGASRPRHAGRSRLSDDALDGLLGLGHAGLDRVLDLSRDEVDLRLKRLELLLGVAADRLGLALDLVAALAQLALDARAALLELALGAVDAGVATALEPLQLTLDGVRAAVRLAEVLDALGDAITRGQDGADVGQRGLLDDLLDLVERRLRLTLGGLRRALEVALGLARGSTGLGTGAALRAVLRPGAGGALGSGAALRRGALGGGAARLARGARATARRAARRTAGGAAVAAGIRTCFGHDFGSP